MTSEKILKLKKMGQYIKILYVEDDKSVSEQFYRFLKKIFSNVYTASNGIDALKLYKKSSYDIVITDIEMPHMDGIEMIEKIRDINEEQAIVVTSAYNNSQYLLKLIDNRIDKFILKPFNNNNIFKVISKLVIQIYKEKKLEQKEVKLKSTQMLNNAVFNKMDVPLLVINENIVEYFNNKFINSFNSNDKCVLAKEFNLASLFYDEYSKLGNEDIINDLLKNNSLVKKLYTHNNKPKKFITNIVRIESKKYLISFYNLDSMCLNVDKVNNQEKKIDILTSLHTRYAFESKLDEITSSEKEYSIMCFCIENIEDLVKSFGVKSLRDIYSQVGKKLNSFFKKEIDDDSVKLYYFDRNNFVALVDKNKLGVTKKLLNTFGEYNGYSKHELDLYEPIPLNVLSKDLEKRKNNTNIMEQVDNLLYMLEK
ncbi:response regulator [Sulfurimonas lithotrophica]|uniref:Response regulator n=1 Tax=Sulfurimonas lithotrophica TaxID=2590022 RepID=A0A5P8P0C7_9BACT|nr:response regulator [Sulfurimonas lithotrophica]QFR49163.1 response regulator [Sulfurimonas lithotrophica]